MRFAGMQRLIALCVWVGGGDDRGGTTRFDRGRLNLLAPRPMRLHFNLTLSQGVIHSCCWALYSPLLWFSLYRGRFLRFVVITWRLSFAPSIRLDSPASLIASFSSPLWVGWGEDCRQNRDVKYRLFLSRWLCSFWFTLLTQIWTVKSRIRIKCVFCQICVCEPGIEGATVGADEATVARLEPSC